MLRDGRFDGLVRRLQAQVPSHRQLAEDAVLEAVARLIAHVERRQVTHVAAFLYRVALNFMRRELKRGLGLESPLHDDAARALAAPDRADALDEQIGRDLLNTLKQITATWNDNIRVVTNLVLDHAFADDYDWMTAEDLASEASQILGAELPPATVTMWKARGLRRLRECLDLDLTDSLEGTA